MITTKKDYKLDLITNTLTITAAFAEAANNPGSKEYRLVRQLQHDFPNLRIEHRTHATPKKYTNSNGRITTHNQYKKLTYKRMEQFMSAIAGGSGYREIYDLLRVSADAVCLSPYAAVRAWFEKQFPEYWKNPLFYVDNEPEIIDFADILDKAERKPHKKLSQALNTTIIPLYCTVKSST